MSKIHILSLLLINFSVQVTLCQLVD